MGFAYLLSANQESQDALHCPFWMLHQFELLYVRDSISLNLLKDHNIQNCTFLPDVVFTFKPNIQRGKSLVRELLNGKDHYERVYAVTTNAHLMGDRTASFHQKNRFHQFANDLAQYIDDTSASFILIPMSTCAPWDDRSFNGYVYSNIVYHQKVSCVWHGLSVQETLDTHSAVDKVVSMRYHSTVFSIISGTPNITIGGHDKFKGLSVDYGMTVDDYWSTNYQQLKNLKPSKNIGVEQLLHNLNERYTNILYHIQPR